DGKPTPLILFGMPNMEQERTDYALEIPVLGSLILRHSLTEPIPALKDFPKEERPNSPIVFWSFRIMVGLGLLMIFQSFYSIWLRKKNTLYTSRW
ncbi:cytochrome ubiquinol oxidase subunit I, partial [Escherichia coli]|nr:cytochrome ubiquinol oxidase subunit I [Escherichia coli]